MCKFKRDTEILHDNLMHNDNYLNFVASQPDWARLHSAQLTRRSLCGSLSTDRQTVTHRLVHNTHVEIHPLSCVVGTRKELLRQVKEFIDYYHEYSCSVELIPTRF